MIQKNIDIIEKENLNEFWAVVYKIPNKEDQPRFLYYYENKYSKGYSVGAKPIGELPRYGSPEDAKSALNYYLSKKKRVKREQFAIVKIAVIIKAVVEHYISLEPTGEQHYEL